MGQNSHQEPLEPLSARALGIYLYMVGEGSYLTSEELSSVFKEGRDAIRTALDELRTYGLITTEKQRIAGGLFITVSRLALPKNRSLKNRSLKSRPLLQLNVYKLINNIKNNLITISHSNKKSYNWKYPSAGADKEKYNTLNIPMGAAVDDQDYFEDLARERDLYLKEQQEEFKDKKRQSHTKALASGKSLNGCIAEFTARVEALWNIEPWKTSKEKFRIAYSKARKTHDTNGDIEFAMMDLFFGSREHMSGINNPDNLWRRFISMFGPLSIQVKNTMLSDEEAKLEQERVERGRRKLFDV